MNKGNHHIEEQQEPRMFVGGLFPETTSETLRNYFSTYGEVKEVKIIGEKQKRSRGFGFVLFRAMKTFHKVMEKKHVIDGREVDCNLAVYSNETKDEAAMKNEKKIFIKKVPPEIQKQNLIDFFSGFGEIDKVLLVKRKNKDHAFAFVEFHDKKVAKGIIEKRIFYVKEKYKVECEMAQPKIRNYLNKVNKDEKNEKKKKKGKNRRKDSKNSAQISKNSSNKNSRENSSEVKNRKNEISVSNIVKKDLSEYKDPQYNYQDHHPQYPHKPQNPIGNYGNYPHYNRNYPQTTQFNPYSQPPPVFSNINQQSPKYPNYPSREQNYHQGNYNNQPHPPNFTPHHGSQESPVNNERRNDNGPRFIHSGSGSISFKSNSSKGSIAKKILVNKRRQNKNDENFRFNKSNPSSRNSNQDQDSKEDTYDENFQYQANNLPPGYLHPHYMAPAQEPQGNNMFNSLGPQLTQPQIIRGLKRQPTQPATKEQMKNKFNQYDPDVVEQQRNPNMLDSNITPKLNEIIRPFPQPNVIYSENNSPFVSTISKDSMALGPGKKAYSARIYTKPRKKKINTQDFDYDNEYQEENEMKEEGEDEQDKRDLISITLQYQKDRDYGKLRSMEEDED